MAITQIRKEQISSVDPTTLSAAVPVNKGGTGLTSVTNGDVLYASADGVISADPAGSTSGVQAHAEDLDNLSSMQTGASAAAALLLSTEVEILDGATVTTAELNILDGATVTTAELNILDGATVTADELNVLSGIESIDTDLTGVSTADDTLASAKAIKSYVDAVANGLYWKDSVVAASTGDVDLSSTTLSPAELDGVGISDGDRVLLKDQTSDSENGIYVATTASNPSTWSRAEDMDSSEEFPSSAVFVVAGTTHDNQGFVCSNNEPPTLETDSITFVQFTGAGQLTGGDGIAISGGTISADLKTNGGLEIDTAEIAVTTDDGNAVFVDSTSGAVSIKPFSIALAGSDAGDDSLVDGVDSIDTSSFGDTEFQAAGGSISGKGSFNQVFLNGVLLTGRSITGDAVVEDITDLNNGDIDYVLRLPDFSLETPETTAVTELHFVRGELTNDDIIVIVGYDQ